MKKIICFIAISIFFTLSSIGQNLGDSPQTKLGFTTIIKSEILEDSLEIFTHLPWNYKNDKEYPLILLLDPHAAFKAFAASTELLAYNRSIPTCIVVGVPQYKYVNYDSLSIEANMNLFAKFLDEELFPYLKSKYNFSRTIIWGPGGPGMISSYFMLEHPDLFDGYIADIPDFKLITHKTNSKNAFNKLKDKNVKYYLFGSKSKDIYNEAFLNNLKSNAPKGLKWNYTISEEPNKIIYRLTNYLHALELFFNDTEE
ncbi:alpha/beta hydrolase-fold protein [Sunxiuqinia sp. sy24]|uniref:alpha/beta hydrolase-fold protein n=1 Tax=Sunxiuqinia sp. sy24 TaxID=3461495 RepID=UPI0040452E10